MKKVLSQAHSGLIVLVLLVCATLASVIVGHGTASASISAGAKAAVIALAIGKVWLVAWQFMELRHAPRIVRYAFDIWLAIIAVVLTATLTL